MLARRTWADKYQIRRYRKIVLLALRSVGRNIQRSESQFHFSTASYRYHPLTALICIIHPGRLIRWASDYPSSRCKISATNWKVDNSWYWNLFSRRFGIAFLLICLEWIFQSITFGCSQSKPVSGNGSISYESNFGGPSGRYKSITCLRTAANFCGIIPSVRLPLYSIIDQNFVVSEL